jgi:hypothetical protein
MTAAKKALPYTPADEQKQLLALVTEVLDEILKCGCMCGDCSRLVRLTVEDRAKQWRRST